MNETRHTPGPWTVNEEDGCIDSEMGWIAQVVGWNNKDDETEPNARLIASAPDLIHALKLCAGVLAGEGLTKGELIAALEASRAAIARAENAPERTGS